VIGIFGTVGQAIETDNLMLAGIMAVFAVAVLCLGPGRSKAQKADVYLSGVSRDSDTRTFANSLGGSTHASARNLYLDGLFGEGRIRRFGEVACGTIQVAAIVASLFFVGIVL
ncbi:MAG: NADH-quinone oxidoreductase subunit L, partial [Eggerthellaceae bacterium]|nr:NADH-quinone oxidoreductase subunit L [Eggerthellaceae bacterium]